MRRRHQGNPLSLFSFQDIITSVTGILILLAIMLAIAVIRQKDSPQPMASAADIDALVEQVAAIEAEIEKLGAIVSETDAQMQAWSTYSLEELQREKASLLASVGLRESELKSQMEVTSRQNSALHSSQSDPDSKRVIEALAQTQSRLAQIKDQLQQFQTGKRVVYNFRDATNPPWMVEISDVIIRAARAGEKGPSQDFSSVAKFVTFAESLADDERYFVLLVKPSGIAKHTKIRLDLKNMGAEIGTELLTEDQVSIDPQSGAVFQ